jgi:CRP/FNR family transcriptional regulator, cyclic AMP receptor protein
MSDTATGYDMERLATVAFLSTVPLFAGVPEAELAELAGLLRQRNLAAGEVLWHEGEPAVGMVLIVDGRISLSLRLPGDRTIEFTSLGLGEVLGEVPLFDGGHHSATARAVEPARVLWLSRADFGAVVARRHATAFALKRRVAEVACGRLRMRLATLAASLGTDPADPPPWAPADIADLEPSGPPDSAYVARLATFRAFDSLALWGFLTAGRFARCPPSRTLVAEGSTHAACYLTMNGAVDNVIIRGGRRIRVGLAGPGQVFGYESLIDGGQAPMTATTRERALLLVLPREAFDRLFHGETAGSHVFLDVINRNLMATLRQVALPQARLASGVTTWRTSTHAGGEDPPAPR